MPLTPDLERVVRPFVDRNAPIPRLRTYWNGTPEPAASTTTTEGSKEGVLTWSARASMNVITLPGLSVVLKEDDNDSDFQLVETERDTTVKRIFNEVDSSQYVDVEVINTLTLKNKAGVQRKFTLDNGDD